MEEENIKGGNIKYLLKYNTLKLKSNQDKRAYDRVIKEMARQLENQEEEINYYKEKYECSIRNSKKLRDRIKELEIGTPHKK